MRRSLHIFIVPSVGAAFRLPQNPVIWDGKPVPYAR